jgi:hypothetical protein
MKLMNVLGSLALAASLSACYTEGHATVAEPVATVEVDEEPPAPQAEAIVVRPGFVWIGGHWARVGGRWAWRGGYYQAERAGYVWGPGRWEIRGRRHVWIEGGWREGPRHREVIVR